MRRSSAAKGSAPTLIFDEIDTGVGGAVADAVGSRLARLAKGLQVVAVTHSPQVAARAGQHFLISKIAEVDGEPVEDREDLRALLQKGETVSVVRSVLSRNSRFNLGSIIRNFNEPTLALLILEPHRVQRFSFDRQEVIRNAGQTSARLSFRERERPTLVRDGENRPVYSRGEITIDAATGRVERTMIELLDDNVLARLTTTYALDEKVDMWVPVTFAERYERTSRDREVILCEAAYTNYRRFEVTARIKGPRESF